MREKLTRAGKIKEIQQKLEWGKQSHNKHSLTDKWPAQKAAKRAKNTTAGTFEGGGILGVPFIVLPNVDATAACHTTQCNLGKNMLRELRIAAPPRAM